VPDSRSPSSSGYWLEGQRLVGEAVSWAAPAVASRAAPALAKLAALAEVVAAHARDVAPWDQPATIADALACYRLLLGRLPDSEGLAHYRDRLALGGCTLGELVGEFLGSVEFTRAHGLAAARGPRPSEPIRTTEGFTLYVDPTDYAVGHTIARDSSYEPEVTATVCELLRDGDVFVDVGANIGWFSMLAAKAVGPTGRVLAVEPNPANTELAKLSAKENGFGNVQVVTVALSDRSGAVALETDGSNGRMVPVDGPPREPIRASYVVASCTLDALVESAGAAHVDVVKLDVEGAEPLVLAGAARTIERDRPVIVSEFYPLALDSAPWGSAVGYLAQLRSFGYKLSVIGSPGSDLDDAAMVSLAKEGKGQVDLLCVPS
jgi:FkbM family methyltransferase